MIFKFITVVVILISPVFCGDFTETLKKSLRPFKPEEVDIVLRNAMPFGEPTIKLPEDSVAYAKVCNALRKMILDPRIAVIFGPGLMRVKEFMALFVTIFKTKIKNKLCELAQTNRLKYNAIALEINNNWDKLVPIKKSYTHAMFAATSKESNITKELLGCYVKKWIDDTINTLEGEAKTIMHEQLRDNYLIPEKLGTGNMTCSWEGIQKQEDTHFQSFEMLFFEAGKVVMADTALQYAGNLTKDLAMSIKNTVILKIENIDLMMVKALPLGDSKIKFPEKAKDYRKICSELMAIDPRVLPIFGVNLVNNPTFTQVAYKFYSDKIQVTRLCEIATKNEADYQRIAKQTNAQWSKLTPIRERYTNATIAAAQPGTIATEEILGCYVKKWLDETLSALEGDVKLIMKDHLKPFYEIPKILRSDYMSCSWELEEFKENVTSKVRSIELLFFEAGKVVIGSNPNNNRID